MIAIAAVAAILLFGAPQASAATTGIGGRVTNLLGAPIPGICVYAQDGELFGNAHTGSDGRYTMQLGVPGRYAVQFAACDSDVENYVSQAYPKRVPVRAGQVTQGIDARLRPGGQISGRILAAETGAPIATVGVSVRARGRNDATPGGVPLLNLGPRQFTDAGGNFVLSGLPAGRYRLYFLGGPEGPNNQFEYADSWYPDSGDPGHATWVTVKAGQAVSVGSGLIHKASSISGTLTANGEPSGSGLAIWPGFREPDGSQYVDHFAYANRDGTYTVTGLQPLDWRLRLVDGMDQPYPGVSQYLQVSPGTTTAGVDFALPPPQPPRVRLQSAHINHGILTLSATTSAYTPTNVRMWLKRRVDGTLRTLIVTYSYVRPGGLIRIRVALLPQYRWARSGTVVLALNQGFGYTAGQFGFQVPTPAGR